MVPQAESLFKLRCPSVPAATGSASLSSEIADAVPDEVRGIGIGTFRTFMDMGGLIGPVAMSTIVEVIGGNTGYIYSFYFGVIMILGLIVITMTLKDTVKKPTATVH